MMSQTRHQSKFWVGHDLMQNRIKKGLDVFFAVHIQQRDLGVVFALVIDLIKDLCGFFFILPLQHHHGEFIDGHAAMHVIQ